MQETIFNDWKLSLGGTVLLIEQKNKLIGSVHFYKDQKEFGFACKKKMLSLPKKVRNHIDAWMEDKSKSIGMAIWDHEAFVQNLP